METFLLNRILSISISAIVIAVSCRVYYFLVYQWPEISLISALGKGLICSYNDILLLLFVILLSMLLLLKKNVFLRTANIFAIYAFSLVFCIFAFVNIIFLAVYNWPLTYQLIYYSDVRESLNFVPRFVVLGLVV